MYTKLPPEILVIESDERLSVSVCNAIERYCFNVVRASTETEALVAAQTNKLHVVIISSRIKDVSALEMAVKIRRLPKLHKIPILFLIDKEEKAENYNSVSNGITALLYRYFTPHQLITNVKALLRKSQPVFYDKVIQHKDLSMNLATYKVYKGNKSIHLGPTEFKILQLLVQSPRTIYSRREIIDYVWQGSKDIEHRTVDVHVNRLRALIKKESKDDIPFIKTVRSSGYCLNLPNEVE